MANNAVHSTVGGLAGATSTLALLDKVDVEEWGWVLLGSTLGGIYGGKLPDILDPPSGGPNHRSTGHSVSANTVGLALYYSQIGPACENYCLERIKKAKKEESDRDRIIWSIALGIVWGSPAGQISHLALDGCTPKMLPL